MIKTLVFTILTAAALILFWRRMLTVIAGIKLGLPESRIDNKADRFKAVLKIALGQSKLLREPLAGTIHFLIFWGFLLFAFAVIESFIQGFFHQFSLAFTGPFYTVITFVQDVFCLLVLAAVVMAFIRRDIIKTSRLQVKEKGGWDAEIILLLIMVIVFSMLAQNTCAAALSNFHSAGYEYRPVSEYIARAVFASGTAGADTWHELFWWIHISAILVFLNYLPSSKHLHIITSIPNVFFARANTGPNVIRKMNLEDETAETFGADDVNKLTWKQILDGYSCTECGRCVEACPAANAGKSLSPRKIVLDIRSRAKELADQHSADIKKDTAPGNILLRHYISETELWQCTTCAACMQECPVMIEHIDSIIDLRRHLVLTESSFPDELNPVFKNLEVNGTPWAFNKSERASWAEGLKIKTMAEDAECEYLFWVGCAGSYDARYQKVSRAFAGIMQKAGVEFRILGSEEKCNGDTARRLGNEYLAQQLMAENIDTLQKYNVKKIVTACPHCFNSLKNEYPQFGGNYQVIHHSQLIESLIQSGKITLRRSPDNGVITYHDSCYLGRYNHIYDAPRNIIQYSSGSVLKEMKRSHSRGFCCGAGGGRMFLEDVEGRRINEQRTEEALALNPSTVATACPFCMTMITDGLKAADKTSSVSVRDIAEIVFENLQ